MLFIDSYLYTEDGYKYPTYFFSYEQLSLHTTLMRHIVHKRLRNRRGIRVNGRKDTPEGNKRTLPSGEISFFSSKNIQYEIIMNFKILICYLYPYLTFKLIL